MNPLEMLFALQGKARGYRDTARNSILQQMGLDPLSMQRQQLEQQGQIQWDQKQRQEQADQQAYAKGASAWAKMNPNIGAGGSYVLSQMGDSPEMRAQAQAMMGAYGAQHAGPSLFQRMQFNQQQDQFDRSFKLDQQRTNAQIAASQAQREGAQDNSQLEGLKFLSTKYQQNMDAPTQVADATQQINNALKSGDSLGSLAAVIKLAKILDPTSVVREGEVTTVQGGLGTAAALINEFNRLGGKGMTPEAAKAFQDIVRQIAGPVLQRGLRLGQEYRASAKSLGVRPELVTTGVGFPEGYVTRYLQGMPDPEVQTDY